MTSRCEPRGEEPGVARMLRCGGGLGGYVAELVVDDNALQLGTAHEYIVVPPLHWGLVPTTAAAAATSAVRSPAHIPRRPSGVGSRRALAERNLPIGGTLRLTGTVDWGTPPTITGGFL